MLKLLVFHPFYGPAQLNKALVLKLILFIGVSKMLISPSQAKYLRIISVSSKISITLFIKSCLYLTVFSSSKPVPLLARN